MTAGERSAIRAPSCQYPDCTRSATPTSMVVGPDSDWEFVWLCNQHYEIVQTHPISAHWATVIRGGESGARERGGDCCE